MAGDLRPDFLSTGRRGEGTASMEGRALAKVERQRQGHKVSEAEYQRQNWENRGSGCQGVSMKRATREPEGFWVRDPCKISPTER